jgi:hypothetical protein
MKLLCGFANWRSKKQCANPSQASSTTTPTLGDFWGSSEPGSIVSFCENGDLLSQWRAYGAKGSGYSLGFEPSALTRNPLGDHFPSSRLLRKAIYDLPTKRALIGTRLAILREVLEPKGAELEAERDDEIRLLITLRAQVAATLQPH